MDPKIFPQSNLRILSLDLGGTAVKARIYSADRVVSETSWGHHYRDCGLENAKTDLLARIKNFSNFPAERIDALGLSVAGLIATDNSLYRSTVLTSFEKFNLPEFLKEELKIKTVTIDNDADCGAFSEKSYSRIGENGLFYVVVGSGIGSAYVDPEGNLPYLTRLKPEHQFSDNDNPLPNDLGLLVGLPKTEIYRKLRKYDLEEENLEKTLLDETGNPMRGPNHDPFSVRIGNLASATGLKKIMEMLFSGRTGIMETWHSYKISHLIQEHPEKKSDLDPEIHENTLAKNLSYFAEGGDYYATTAFEIFGYFLGCGIAEAEKFVRGEQCLNNFPDLCLSGPIINSFNYFKKDLGKCLSEKKISCELRLSQDLNGPNLHGAYLRVKEVLEN